MLAPLRQNVKPNPGAIRPPCILPVWHLLRFVLFNQRAHGRHAGVFGLRFDFQRIAVWFGSHPRGGLGREPAKHLTLSLAVFPPKKIPNVATLVPRNTSLLNSAAQLDPPVRQQTAERA